MAATAAQGRRADAAAAPLEFVDQADDDPGAGAADRVAEGDGAAVGVHVGGVQIEHLGRPKSDRGECFVDFDDIEVGWRQLGALERDLDGFGGTFVECGVDPADLTVGEDLGHDRSTDGLGGRP